MRRRNNDDAAANSNVLKTNTALQALLYVLLLFLSLVDYLREYSISEEKIVSISTISQTLEQ
jgi:hypothetical protein